MMSVTALQMFEDGVGSRRLAFGCELIDKCTRGGLPLQGINEIVGEAGAGKTQFALTLSLQCHLIEAKGGLSGATAYICCGEGLFPVRRLEQLSHCFQNKSGISYTEFMDSVHIEQCHNADDVLHTLLQKIPNMCTTKGIRLIVIDSIAGMVRTEYDTSSSKDMALRTSLLFRLAKELKWLSDIFHVCIVVINQVTASGFERSENSFESQNQWGDSSNPALGLAWAHCVNTRIRLRRDSCHFRSIDQSNNENENDYENGRENDYENGNENEIEDKNDDSLPYDSRGPSRNICYSKSGNTHNSKNCSSYNNSNSNSRAYDNIDNSNSNNHISSNLIDHPHKETAAPSISSQSQSKTQSQTQLPQGGTLSVNHGSSRLLTLELSPCNQKASCLYEIRNDGVFGLH